MTTDRRPVTVSVDADVTAAQGALAALVGIHAVEAMTPDEAQTVHDRIRSRDRDGDPIPDFRLRCPFCGGELSISLDWRGSEWLSEQVPDAIQCGDCFAEWERNGDLRLAPEAASLAEAQRWNASERPR